MLLHRKLMSRTIPGLIAAIILLGTSSPATAATCPNKKIHKVKRGDSLGKIAKKHKVSLTDLRRWNKLRKKRGKRADIIHVGQILTICLKGRPKRQIKYVVRGGDNPTKIAKRFKMTVADLKKLNRKAFRRKHLYSGMELVVNVSGPAIASKSTGTPRYGTLVNGEQLPKGPGYIIKSPKRTWGTNQTITYLMDILPRTRKKFPKNTPNVVIGDISKKAGGYFPPHRSHQNGLDIDIGYYHKVTKSRPHPRGFRVAKPSTLDVPRTWFLLNEFLKTRDVNYIFVDYALQKPLYEYAIKQPFEHCIKPRIRARGRKARLRAKRKTIAVCKKQKKEWFSRTFQYPRPKPKRLGIIRHSRSHHHHFHLRFNEPDSEKNRRARKAKREKVKREKAKREKAKKNKRKKRRRGRR